MHKHGEMSADRGEGSKQILQVGRSGVGEGSRGAVLGGGAVRSAGLGGEGDGDGGPRGCGISSGGLNENPDVVAPSVMVVV